MSDPDHLHALLTSRDRRFDGRFVVAVTTTRVYCRPSCPAPMPKPAHLRGFPSPAAAQQDGYRACRRCRPDAAPGSPDANVRADVAGRAMRLISDGLVDREGVAGLAARLGYGERQLHRHLVAELGAGPQALARARRAQTARDLLESTDMAAADVAFAAGFASVRQFNETVRRLYGTTPTALRGARRSRSATGAAVELRLAYRPPFDAAALFGYLAARALPGVEEGGPGFHRRSLRLPYGMGVATLRDGGGHVRCELLLDDMRDLAAAVNRCRVLLDLDADPREIGETLGADPVLAPLVAARPGLRVPGHPDPGELALRLVARSPERLVERFGRPLREPVGTVTHAFPSPEALAEADTEVTLLARALASVWVVLDPGVDRDEAERRLAAVPGVDAWTARYVRMRALADPDVWPSGEMCDRWRPWRSYALHHLWAGRRQAVA
ncbi:MULTISPECIES: AlkA N-terminal domain-containing protein [unclassified Nonomuraea]|uniref:DNA-3-methyladenine glycosylase 2 n=1 Tax=unclassified Nonomuraea TaxID=2593643 RepID=UPI0033CB9685